MHRDVVDVLDELGALEPDVPRLRRAHRLLDGVAHAIQLSRQLGDAQVVAQNDFVADHQADDVRMTVGDVDRRGDLGLVGRRLRSTHAPSATLSWWRAAMSAICPRLFSEE